MNWTPQPCFSEREEGKPCWCGMVLASNSVPEEQAKTQEESMRGVVISAGGVKEETARIIASCANIFGGYSEP